jgi:hypothetical protein
MARLKRRILNLSESEADKPVNVGIRGGSSAFGLGRQSDIQALFELIKRYAVNEDHKDWSILTERLYRHYIGREDWDRAMVLVKEVGSAFSKVPTESVDWKTLIDGETKLDPAMPTLAHVFERFFEAFDHTLESARLWDNSEDGFYKPIHLTWVKFPDDIYFGTKYLSLESLDTIQGDPVWMCNTRSELKARINELNARVGFIPDQNPIAPMHVKVTPP